MARVISTISFSMIATLVALAEETGINEIFILDIRGFHAYRIHGRKVFAIYPA